MPRSKAHKQFQELPAHPYGGLALGMAWGAFAGVIIGTGSALTIGLFYTSAALMIMAVISVSGALGAIFGYVLARLLNDEVIAAGRVMEEFHPADHRNAVYLKAAEVVHLSEHRALKAEMTKKAILYPNVNHPVRPQASLPPYSPDVQVFEMIVATAQRAQPRPQVAVAN